MNYSSRLGSIFFTDPYSYKKQYVCDPTLLFLLGLESVITSVLSNNSIIIPKHIYNKDHELVVLSEYNAIKLFLSTLGNIEDHTTYIEFKCEHIKAFMNSLTGDGSDRISPLVLHDSADDKYIDLSKPMYRLPEDDRDSKSNYDLLSQKIHDLFEDAGYSYKCSNLDFTDDPNYNTTIKNIHQEKLGNKDLYKLIDYKSMYSYALGVLYGCYYKGYGDIVWSVDPTSWYTGSYKNLVSTAFNTFRFRHTKNIPSVDNNDTLYQKYKGIQQNKIWNYNEEEHEDHYKPDQILCSSVSIYNNTVYSTNILYSESKGPQSPIPGSYLLLDDTEWKPIDSSVLCSNPKIGIVDASKESYIIRYIANDEVLIKKAIATSSNIYLSPNDHDRYFIYTGNSGWNFFDETSYNQLSPTKRVLTLSPTKFDAIQTSSVHLARSKDTSNIVAFYKCDISDESSLYGILDDTAIIGGIINVEDDAKFVSILSDESFTQSYDYPIQLDGYTLSTYYNIDIPVSIYVYDHDPSKMWVGSDSPELISSFGYTDSPSVFVDAYIDSDGDAPDKFNLRYNSDDKYGYWSSEWIPREWKHHLSDDIFILSDKVQLYRNTENIINNLQSYYTVNDQEDIYVFNNHSIQYLSQLSNGFIPILGDEDSLYSIGITTYSCSIIYTDDYGNSLLDEYGRPLVWYDSKTDKYWNGLYNINKWQNEKPAKFSKYMYDSLTNQLTHVYDNEYEETICIDGNFITYTDFYSHSNYGIVRNKLMVFNNSVSDSPLECFNDTYSNKYCIPNITQLWVNRSEISLLGFTFVDGIADLYIGDNLLNLIFDADPID